MDVRFDADKLQELLRDFHTLTGMRLVIFDRSFTKWGEWDEELLTYDAEKDRLIGTRDYNGAHLSHKERFYRRLSATNEEMRIPVLVQEI